MSHITDIKLRVKDLDALEEVGEALGLTLQRGQKTHKWFGRFVGDTRPPAGLAVEDYGKCEHALGLKNHQAGDYEIGVVKALDGGEGYDLVTDTWNQTRLLNAVGGAQMNRLRQEYAASVALKRAKATLARKGFVASRVNGGGFDGGVRHDADDGQQARKPLRRAVGTNVPHFRALQQARKATRLRPHRKNAA
jgi:hypothetical protein